MPPLLELNSLQTDMKQKTNFFLNNIFMLQVCREFNSKSNGESHFEKRHSIKKLWHNNYLKLLFFGLRSMVRYSSKKGPCL